MQLHRLTTVAVCLGFVAAACSGSDTAETTAATTTSATTQPTATTQIEPTTTTTTTSELSEESSAAAFDAALRVKDGYFAAFNAGDSEAVMGLFTPDATFAFQHVGDSAEPILRAFWEEKLVWNTAQGTIMTTHDCVVIDEAPGVVTVECDHGTHDAPAQAVEAVAVPTTTTMKITPDGIGEFHELYGDPDFTFVGVFFDAWIKENHPDDALAAGFGNWSSLEEANEHGRINAQYADEWAAEVQATGCPFNQANC